MALTENVMVKDDDANKMKKQIKKLKEKLEKETY